MTVNNFPSFEDFTGNPNFPDRGLKEINFWGKISICFRQWAFKRKVPNQPSFFISRSDWGHLVSGSHITDFKTKYPNHEIYGFVFCIAFSNDLVPNTQGSAIFSRKLAYFRIRTILRCLTEKHNSKNIEVEVETENIAYVNIETALKNKAEGKSNSCLEFITKEETLQFPEIDIRKNKINTDVIRKQSDVFVNQENIPNTFKQDMKKYKILLIQNEGTIFSKERIWNDILLSHPEAEGIEITLLWNGSKNDITCHFKVNPSYETSIKCPQPQTCA
jgi:hypothetical protein